MELSRQIDAHRILLAPPLHSGWLPGREQFAPEVAEWLRDNTASDWMMETTMVHRHLHGPARSWMKAHPVIVFRHESERVAFCLRWL